MRKFFILAPLFIFLSGCWLSQNFSPEIQSKWQGRPVSELNARIGGAEIGQDPNGQKYYYWKQVLQRTSTGQLSPMGWSEIVSCEFRAYVDNQDRITRLSAVNKGINCAHYSGIIK